MHASAILVEWNVQNVKTDLFLHCHYKLHMTAHEKMHLLSVNTKEGDTKQN